MRRARREVKKVVVEEEGESEEESADDEEESEYEGEDLATKEDEEDEEQMSDEEEENGEEEGEEEEAKEVVEEVTKPKRERKPITIKLKGGKFCKVCKKTDHQAGFVGSIYLDCPNKPCYLCKKPGHTTMTCPHRIASEHGVAAVSRRHALGLFDFVHERQVKGHVRAVKMMPVIPNKVDVAIIKLHSRRVTHLEFHPTKDNIVISGDKKGQLGIWDFETMVDKTVYTNVHTCLVNSIKLHPFYDGSIYTSSSDGTVRCTDLETGVPSTLLDLNPDGWHGPQNWKMMYALDINLQRHLVLTADNDGFIHQFDTRTGKASGKPVLLHTKKTKLVGIHCNPIDPDVFLTCGNDHTARLWDVRFLDSTTSMATLPHPRVVNSAYFSPVSGNKIMTTCQDNRIRVWDCLFGDLENPSREIVHSHDFNRYLTPFKAEWDPKDASECLAVIGRYISDDFDGLALHPVDFIDVSTGKIVAQVMDRNITTISPVNKLHPRLDLMVTGSSRSLFLWRPKEDNDGDEVGEQKTQPRMVTVVGDEGKQKGRGKGKSKADEDDESDDCPKVKKSKVVETKVFTRKRRS